MGNNDQSKKKVFGSFSELFSETLTSGAKSLPEYTPLPDKASSPSKSSKKPSELKKNKAPKQELRGAATRSHRGSHSPRHTVKDRDHASKPGQRSDRPHPPKDGGPGRGDGRPRKQGQGSRRFRFNYEVFNQKRQEGLKKLDSKDCKGAEEIFNEIIEHSLSFTRNARTTGEKRTGGGDLDGALKEYEQVQKVFKRIIPIFYARGISRIELGDIEGAIGDFTMVLKYQEDHKKAYLKRGTLQKQLGKDQEALDDFLQVVKLDPKEFHVLYMIGDLQKKLNLAEDAVKSYRKALDVDPNHPSLHFKKGLTSWKRGHLDKALREFDHAIAKALKIGRNLTGENFKKKNLQEIKPESLKTLKGLRLNIGDMSLKRGEVKRQRGYLAEALEDYSFSLLFRPDDIQTHFKRGEIRYEIGQYKEAVEDFSSLISSDPEHSKALVKRANAYLKIKEYQKALDDFSKVIKKEPFNVPVYGWRGDTLFAMGKKKGALDDYSKVIEFRTDDPTYYYKRAKVYLEDRKTKELAAKDLMKALNLDSNSCISCIDKAKSLRKDKDFAKAIECLDQGEESLKQFIKEWYPKKVKSEEALLESMIDFAKDNDFDLLELYYLRAQSRRDLDKDLSKALEDYQFILQTQEDYKDTLMKRGLLYSEMGTFRNALKDLNRVLEMDSHNEEGYYYRALAYEKKEDYDNSVKDFHRVLKINPSNSQYHLGLGRTLFQQHALEGAYHSIKRAIELCKTSSESFDLLAKILLGEEDEKYRDPLESIKQASKAVEIDPLPEYKQTLAKAYSISGNLAKALEIQEELVKVAPKTPQCKELLEGYKEGKNFLEIK